MKQSYPGRLRIEINPEELVMRYIAAAIALMALTGRILSASDEPCTTCHAHHHCAAHECVKVPETKTIKKTVYDVKCVPVCEHRPAKFLHCDCCPVCDLKYKKVLVKREIVVAEVCITKCVPVELPCNCSKE
jgi:hypothetical protein